MQYRVWTAQFWGYIGDLRPEQVSAEDVSRFILKRCGEVGGRTMIYFRKTLLRFFMWMEDNNVIAKNPLSIRKLPKISGMPRKRPGFSREQYQAIIKYANERRRHFSWREVCILGWHTGLRISDACNLRWEQVDLDNRILTVTPKKTRKYGKVLVIPMTDELYGMLRDQRDHPKYPALAKNPYVFPDMCWEGLFSKRVAIWHFNDILRRAAIPHGFTFHSFRHAFCTRLINSGSNVLVIQSMTGQTLEVLQGYVMISNATKLEAFRNSGERVDSST